MQMCEIAGATRVMVAPKDWKGVDGPCHDLQIQDVPTPEGNFMVSAWRPTDEELAELMNGKAVLLWIRGTEWPVVSLGVSE